MPAAKKRVLMCCSSLDVKGGMVSVVKNYLEWPDWGEYEIVFVPTHVPGGKIRVAAHFALTLPKIKRLIAQHDVNLVHLHVAERGSFFRKAIIAREAKRAGIPVVLHHHAAEFEEFYAGLDESKRRYVEETFNLADVNLVLSGAIERTLRAHFPHARFQVLYNAVNIPHENAYSSDASGISFMGRLGERKGAYDLVRAFAAALPSIDSRFHLELCGDGDIDQVSSLIEDLGISSRARCLGWVSPQQRAEVFSRAALNVLPSYNEGLPMSILEAFSFGVPTISTPVAAIPEVVHEGETGLLVQPGDVDALSAAIIRLLGDASLRRSMSDSAYRFVSAHHALQTNIDQVKELYRKLC